MRWSRLSSLIYKFIVCFLFFMIYHKKSQRAAPPGGCNKTWAVAGIEHSLRGRNVSTITACKNQSTYQIVGCLQFLRYKKEDMQ